MKKLMLAALVASLSTGCAIAPNGANRSTATVAAQPQKPAFLPTPKAVGVNKNQCFAYPQKGYEGLLIAGGRNSQGQFYSCAPGATLQTFPLSPDLVAAIVPYLCDANKPVMQTAVLDGTDLKAMCVFRGNSIPEYVRGVRIQVVQ